MGPILLSFLMLLADQSTPLLQRGLLALQRGDLVQAKATLEQVAKSDPRNPYAWASLAETYSRLKQPAPAREAAGKAERFGADNPAISHVLAVYYTHAGQFASAARLEAKYAESGNADRAAFGRAASLYLNAGDAPSALRLLEKAPPSPEAENLKGRALIASGNLKEGGEHLALAAQGAPENSQIAFDYAQVLLQAQDFDHVATVVATALERHPNDAQLVLTLGVARYGQRRFDDAIAAFLKVIRIDPQVEQPYVFLGRVLDQAGAHLPEVLNAYEKWSTKYPQNPTGLLLLAKAKLAMDPKDSTAEALLRKSTRLNGQNWEAHYELGVLLAGKRDFQNAAAELKRSVELSPQQPMPHYHLARVFDRLGDADKAQVERDLHGRLTSSSK